MAVILTEIFKSYQYWIVERSDPRSIDWPLMRTPFPTIAIVALYLWFVFKAGPKYMENRQPFNLDKIIQAYNLVQVVVCAFIAAHFFIVYKPWGPYDLICEESTFEVNEFTTYGLKIVYLYFVLKIVDLLDTVFFVLRKKPRQVTFLHVYHHVIMVVVCWWVMRFVPEGQSVLIGIVNSLVHSIMYFYYFISNYDKTKGKYLWCKKYLTQLQMFQFGTFALCGLIAMLTPDCKYPRLVISLLFPQNLFIFILFWDFYRKTYIVQKETPKVEKTK